MNIKLAKEILREEDYLSFLCKVVCVWQTHGLKRRSRGK